MAVALTGYLINRVFFPFGQISGPHVVTHLEVIGSINSPLKI